MANLKISELDAAAALDGTEKIPAVQSGQNVALTPNQIATLFGTYTAWTPTFTGFSTDPTVIARYIRIGKMCHVVVGMSGSSVSNATTFTMTLPFAAANTNIQVGAIQCINNGATATVWGRIATAVNSNVASLFTDAAGGVWVGSGVKRANFVFTYETT